MKKTAEAVQTTRKFRKVRNEKRWVCDGRTAIDYNPFFNTYMVNKGTMFASAKTLAEAIEIANTDFRFR